MGTEIFQFYKQRQILIRYSFIISWLYIQWNKIDLNTLVIMQVEIGIYRIKNAMIDRLLTNMVGDVASTHMNCWKNCSNKMGSSNHCTTTPQMNAIDAVLDATSGTRLDLQLTLRRD